MVDLRANPQTPVRKAARAMGRKIEAARLQFVDPLMRQADLAAKIGKTQVSMSRYENGQRMPDWHTLVKIAEHLHVTPEALGGINPEKAKAKKAPKK